MLMFKVLLQKMFVTKETDNLASHRERQVRDIGAYDSI